MQAVAAQPAGATAGKEVKWAKGLTQNARGDLWCMAFQIRGKRHALSLRCSQAEAAVAFDLGCYWAHAAKGNNPEGSTRYNFGVAWFPRTLLAELLALPDWAAVKASVARMLALGVLSQLVPFEGAGRRFSVAPVDGGRSQAGLELCVNARGVHFFRASGWTCIPAEDVRSFGCRGPLLQLTYTPPPTGGPVRPKAPTTVVLSCDTAGSAAQLYSQLQEAAALRASAGMAAALDLGAAIAQPPGGASVFSSTLQMRPGRAGVAAAARADLLLSQEEEEEAGEDGSPACSAQTSAAAAAAALDDGPSLEEVALFAEFAELARSASGSGTVGGGGCAAVRVMPHVKPEPAAEAVAAEDSAGRLPSEPCGVAPPKSPAVQPAADPAAARSRSSLDGGSSSTGGDAPLQRQGSEAGSSEAQLAAAPGADRLAAQQPLAPLPPPLLQQHEPEDAEEPTCKKQRCEEDSPKHSHQQVQQQPQQAQQLLQPAVAHALGPPHQVMKHAAGQQVHMAAMPVPALPPAMLHQMAALQQAAAAASMARAAASTPAAPATADGSPTAAAGTSAPFAMPSVGGMVPMVLPPAVAVAMQRQLAAAQQAASGGMPCAVPLMVPAVAGPWVPAAAALLAKGSTPPK